MTTVQVLLADRSYPIRIRPGSLSEIGEALVKEFESRRVVVITTPRVGRSVLERIAHQRITRPGIVHRVVVDLKDCAHHRLPDKKAT